MQVFQRLSVFREIFQWNGWTVEGAADYRHVACYCSLGISRPLFLLVAVFATTARVYEFSIWLRRGICISACHFVTLPWTRRISYAWMKLA